MKNLELKIRVLIGYFYWKHNK